MGLLRQQAAYLWDTHKSLQTQMQTQPTGDKSQVSKSTHSLGTKLVKRCLNFAASGRSTFNVPTKAASASARSYEDAKCAAQVARLTYVHIFPAHLFSP